jgi:hypothetical protein
MTTFTQRTVPHIIELQAEDGRKIGFQWFTLLEDSEGVRFRRFLGEDAVTVTCDGDSDPLFITNVFEVPELDEIIESDEATLLACGFRSTFPAFGSVAHQSHNEVAA